MSISKTRTSLFIQYAAAVEFLAAVNFALFLGRPFTTWVTVDFERAGAGEHCTAFVTAFWKHLRDWLAIYGVPAVYVWVLEGADGEVHMHALLHIPPRLALELHKMLPDWMRAIGLAYYEGITDIDCIGVFWGSDRRTSKTGRSRLCLTPYFFSLRHVVSYSLKGAVPEFCAEWGIQHKPQGKIIGKRTGTSESLGPRARRLVLDPPLQDPARPLDVYGYGPGIGVRTDLLAPAIEDD